MATDPNWFYSTLAQSSAAIVGLTGGFFVQRLLVQRTEALEQRGEVRNEVEGLFEEVAQLRADLERVVRAALRTAVELREQGRAGFEQVQLKAMIPVAVLTGGSVSETRGTVVPIETARAQDFVAVADALRAALNEIPSTFEEFVIALPDHHGLPAKGLWLEPPRRHQLPSSTERPVEWLPYQTDVARSRWLGLRTKAKPVAERYLDFRAQIIPRSFFALVTILFLFLIIGVIAPLFFLSPTGELSRTVMLMAFIPLCIAFIIYVGFELTRLRAIGDLVRSEIAS